MLLAGAAPLPARDGAAGEPAVEVSLGFGGAMRLGGPVAARLEIRNDGPAYRGEFVLQESAGGRPTVAWALPLEVPAGARTVRWLTISPTPTATLGGQWELTAGWAGSRRPPQPLSPRFVRPGQDSWLVVTVTDLATGFSGVRQALDPAGVAEVQMPAITPEEAPPEPAAWEAADAILVSLAAAQRLDAPAWSAIAARVAQGAPLLVHGPGRLPELMPEALRPGRVPEGAGPQRWTEPSSLTEHSAMPYRPAPDGERLRLAGEELSWAVSRRFGLGRVSVAGLDLRNLRAGLDEQERLWAELIGLRAAGSAQLLRAPERFIGQLGGHASAQRSFTGRGFAFTLGLAAVLGLGALVAVRRAARRGRLARVGPLACALAALPLFLLGGLSRLVEDRQPFVVEEHWEALGRSRLTTLLEPGAEGERELDLELPGWPVRVQVPGALPPAGRFVAGEPPRVRGLRPAASGGLLLEAERWEPAGAAPFSVDRNSEGLLRVTNRSGRDLVRVQVLEGSRLTSLGSLAAGESRSTVGAPPEREAAGHAALAGAAGRRAALGVAGEIAAGRRGLLRRPADGLVVGWLEEAP